MEMRRDGWDRARVLNLPYEEHGYWWTQRRGMERLLETPLYLTLEASVLGSFKLAAIMLGDTPDSVLSL